MFSVFIEHYKNNEKLRLFTKIIVVWLLSRIVMQAMVPVMNLVADTPHNLLYYMNPWDAEWYKELAEEGYKLPRSSGMANWAFFPLYPMVCALIRIITGGYINTYAIGMLVSNICIIIAVYYAVRFAWLELDTDKYDRVDIENIIIFLMFAGPCAVYYGSMYTESLFTMCVVLCFYNTKKKNYMMAGVSAALASATRIVGCTLIVVLFTDMYVSMYKQHRDEERRIVAAIKAFIKDVISDAGKLLALAICPLGIFVYMTFLRGFCGDAWAFYHVQKAWRTQKLFPVIGVLIKSCTGRLGEMSDVKQINGIILGWLCVFTLLMYVIMLVRKHYACGIFGIIALMIPLTSSVMSTLRFIVGSFVDYRSPAFNRQKYKACYYGTSCSCRGYMYIGMVFLGWTAYVTLKLNSNVQKHALCILCENTCELYIKVL